MSGSSSTPKIRSFFFTVSPEQEHTLDLNDIPPLGRDLVSTSRAGVNQGPRALKTDTDQRSDVRRRRPNGSRWHFRDSWGWVIANPRCLPFRKCTAGAPAAPEVLLSAFV